MTKKLISINSCIPYYGNCSFGYSSKRSIQEADFILINPAIPNSGYEDSTFEGKKCYSKDESFIYLEHSEHWKKEILDFTNNKKTVFIMLDEKKEFYLSTGGTTYSGSGKSRVSTNTVHKGNNYSFLPLQEFTIHTSRATEGFQFGDKIFNNYFTLFKSLINYQSYCESVNIKPIIVGKDKKRILGGYQKVKGGGHIVYLPYIKFDEPTYLKQNGDWSKKGIDFGNKFVEALLEIDSNINKIGNKTIAPKWVENKKYKSIVEINLSNEISELNKQKEVLENQIKIAEDNMEKDSTLKNLLFENSKILENAVIEALNLLGFEAVNYDDGTLELDQVITSPEGHRYIGECEGKDSKDIHIDKYRQLLESINRDFDRDEIEEKAYGMLFGNPQRLTEPDQRNLDFTSKLKTGAKSDKIALIKTPDLYKVAKYLKETPDLVFQKNCRESIHNQLGQVVIFPNIPKS